MDHTTPLTWSAQYVVNPYNRSTKLSGDKILLPPSALEQLLAAAPLVSVDSNIPQPYTSSFDPYNPYSYAAERQARAQFADQQKQLPHPLTFRIVNPQNGRVAYAGIREFSAQEGEVEMSAFLRQALGLADDPEAWRTQKYLVNESTANGEEEHAAEQEAPTRITVHAKQLQKGTYVKLRPLEAGYDPEDWKSLLEKHLRANFTTLTNAEVLTVPGGRGAGGKNEEFRFLLDGFKPEADGVCIVDTDLEVDIEPLNEEQARETLNRIAQKAHRGAGTKDGSSTGGNLSLFGGQEGQVVPGEYVDYQLPSWDRSQGLDIELSGVNTDQELDLFVSPFSSRQRVRPRDFEHIFGDFSSRSPKRIKLQPTNVEHDNTEALWVSVHAYNQPASESEHAPNPPTPESFFLRIAPIDPKIVVTGAQAQPSLDTPPNSDEVRCKNCRQWVPQRTLFLHENFCLRNNVLCPQGCDQVFQKRSASWENHWHCPHDTFWGNSGLSLSKHNYVYHTQHDCASCAYTASSLPQLAHHRTSTCPGKLILCQFCHLEVEQEGDPNEPNAESLISGLTPHELADGARTTECHMCNKIVRLRDMALHLKHHDYERLSRPEPRVCRNVNCGRTLDGVGKNGDTRAGSKMGQGPGNDIGLCSTCFGPLYVAMYDPEGKALRRRVERRYLSQLLTGCGKNWCRNEFCKTGRTNVGGRDAAAVSTKDALPMIAPYLEGLKQGGTPLHFCVDEGSQRRRSLAEMVAAEGGGKAGYAFNWCVAALEAEGGDLDRARSWLANWAPKKGEGG